MTPQEKKARTFVRGVSSVRQRWGQQTMTELRESKLDEPTRRALPAMARECSGLLEDHPAEWTLLALIGLDPDALSEPSAEQASVPQSRREPGEWSKEDVADWIDMVRDALLDLYGPENPSNAQSMPNTTVSVRLPSSYDSSTSLRAGRTDGQPDEADRD